MLSLHANNASNRIDWSVSKSRDKLEGKKLLTSYRNYGAHNNKRVTKSSIYYCEY